MEEPRYYIRKIKGDGLERLAKVALKLRLEEEWHLQQQSAETYNIFFW